MLRNYIKVAFRSLARYKLFSFINILGLGVSLTVGMLIILMLNDQKSYDQFHENKDRIYRIISRRGNSSNQNATSPMPLRNEVNNHYQGVEKMTQLSLGLGGDLHYDLNVMEVVGFFADQDFFGVFSFPLTQGNPSTALKDPNSIVITQKVADRLFPDGDAFGKRVNFKERGLDIYRFGFMIDKPVDYGDYTVTGIIPDHGHKSHLKFDILVSVATMYSLANAEIKKFPFNDWNHFFSSFNYVLLDPGADAASLQNQLNEMAMRVKPESEKYALNYELQPLSEITPGKMLNNMTSISLPLFLYYILMVLAFLVIFLACLNYTSLSIARAVSRAREIGIRKVNGAGSLQIFFQFLGESILVSLVALLIGYLLLMIIRPSFMSLWINQYLNFELSDNAMVFFWFFIFACFAGALAGLFPGLYLSKFKPAEVMKNFKSDRSSKSRGKRGWLNFLVVFQFAVSLIFTITTIVIYRQVNHFHKAEYGYRQENVLNVDLQGQDYQKVMNRFSQISEVEEISASEYIPGTGFMEQMRLYADTATEAFNIRRMMVSQHFFELMEIPLIAGEHLSDQTLDGNHLIVNRKAAAELGFEDPDQIIGATFYQENKTDLFTVVGVVEDFKIEMIFQQQEAALFKYDPDHLRFLNIRFHPGKLQNLKSELEIAWNEFDPAHQLKSSLFEDTLRLSSALFTDVAKIIGYISFLAVIISCFGLLGMVTLDTERRVREIGVRKVLGANIWQLLSLLLKGFFKVFGVMLMVALPLAYLLNQKGLETIANRINLSWDIFAMGVLGLLLLAMLTIASQTLKAALTNPAHILKND